MMTRDQLAVLLRSVPVAEVATASGMSSKTIYRLRHKITSPTLGTVERLVAAVRKVKAQRRGAKATA